MSNYSEIKLFYISNVVLSVYQGSVCTNMNVKSGTVIAD